MKIQTEVNKNGVQYLDQLDHPISLNELVIAINWLKSKKPLAQMK